MAFTPDHLHQVLQTLPRAARYWVAFSGGLDSHVLLHAVTTLAASMNATVLAIHVDHGLSPRSAAWSEHCRHVAQALGITYHSFMVDAAASPGESREAAARHARYQCLRQVLEPGDVLLTAQHNDDQAETLLLQLMRGAGVRGLGAMRLYRPFGSGYLARPLLAFGRRELREYAEVHRLRWVEDPSNFDTQFDRNYLRHEIMPRLRSRWPAAERVIARSAGLLAEADDLLDEVGLEDLARARGGTDATLSAGALRRLSGPRRRNLLRCWLRQLGLPVPGSERLRRIEQEVLGARPDAMPVVSWNGAEVRRYREEVYAMAPLAAPPHLDEAVSGELPSAFCLPTGDRLTLRAARGEGIRAELVQLGGLRVRFRRGGERCRPEGRRHRRDLKRLFQEAGVAPWERARVPLLFLGEELAWVGGLGYCAAFTAGADEQGVVVEWHRTVLRTPIETEGENNENYAGPAPTASLSP